jgi:hypothetical protein
MCISLQSNTEDAGNEVIWMHDVSTAVALSHVRGVQEDRYADFRSKGRQELADALLRHEAQWAGHSLGDATAIKSMAEQAQNLHGQGAADALKEEAAKFFKTNRISRAVVKWRAALWLLFSRELCADAFYLWDILRTRHALWEEVRVCCCELLKGMHARV